MTNLKATIEISSVGAKRGSKDIQNELKAIRRQISAVIGDTQKLSAAFANMSKGIKSTQNVKFSQTQLSDLKKIQAAHKQLNKTMEQAAKSSLTKTTQAYKTFATNAVKSLKSVQTSANGVVKSLNSIKTAATTTKSKMQQLGSIQLNVVKTTSQVAAVTQQAAQGMNKLGTTATKVSNKGKTAAGDVKDFNRKLTELSKVAQIALGPLSGIASRITAFATLSSLAGVALAGLISATIGIVGLGVAAIKTVNQVDALAKRASELGVAAEELQRLRFVGDQSGVDVDLLDRSLEALSRRIGQAVDAAGQGGRALETLGLKAEDLVSLNVQDQLKIIADRFIQLEDDSVKAAVAADLFSRAGLKMINVLSLGSAGIEELSQKANELGIIFSSRTLKDAERLNDKISQLTEVLKVNFQKVLLTLMPIIEKWTDRLIRASVAAARWLEARSDLGTRTDVSLLEDEVLRVEALASAYNSLTEEQKKSVQTAAKAGTTEVAGRFRELTGFEVTPAISRALVEGTVEKHIDLVEVFNEQLALGRQRFKELTGEVREFGDIGPIAVSKMREGVRDLFEDVVQLTEDLRIARIQYEQTVFVGPEAGEFAKNVEVQLQKIRNINAGELSQFVNQLRQSGQLTSTEIDKLASVFDEKGKVIFSNLNAINNEFGDFAKADAYRVVAEVLARLGAEISSIEEKTQNWARTTEDSARKVKEAVIKVTEIFDEANAAQGRLAAFRSGGEEGVALFDIQLRAQEFVKDLSAKELTDVVLDLSSKDLLDPKFVKDVQDKFSMIGDAGINTANTIKAAFESGVISSEDLVSAIEKALIRSHSAEETLAKDREIIEDRKKRSEKAAQDAMKEREKQLKDLQDAQDDYNESFDKQIMGLENEIKLVQLSSRERAIAEAIMEREAEVRSINLKLGREELEVTQEQRDAIANLTGQLYDLNEERKRQEEIAKLQEQIAKEAIQPWIDFGEDLSQIIGDSIADGLDQGKFSFESFIKDIKRAFFQAIGQNISNTIKQLFTLPEIPVQQGSTSAATSSAGAFSQGSLLSISNLTKIGTAIGKAFANFFSSGPSTTSTTTVVTPSAAVSTVTTFNPFKVTGSTSAPTQQPSRSQQTSVTQLTDTVGSIGMGGGGAAEGFLGNFQTGFSGGRLAGAGGASGALGSILGGISGAMTANSLFKGAGGFSGVNIGNSREIIGTAENPFVYDPQSKLEKISNKVGTWIGALIGSYYGGVIGGILGGLTGGAMFTTAAQIVNQLRQGHPFFESASALQSSARGALIFGPIGAVIGGLLHNKPDIELGIGTAQSEAALLSRGIEGGSRIQRGPFGFVGALGGQTGGDLPNSAVNNAVKFIVDLDKSLVQLLTEAEENIVRAVGFPDFNISNPKKALRKITGHRVRQILAPLGISERTIQGAVQLNTPEDILKQAQDILTAQREMKALVDGLKGVVEVAPKAKSAIEEIEAALEAVELAGPELGFVEDITKLREKALAGLVEGFNLGIEDEILAFVNPLALELQNLDLVQKQRLEEAQYLGADLVQVERLNMLERVALVEQYNQQINGSIKQMLDDLLRSTNSPLAPTAIFENVKAQFAQTKELAFGDNPILAQIARTDITGVASNLLDVARDLFASSPAFFEQFDMVVDTLENLLTEPLMGTSSLEQINLDQNIILRSIADLLSEEKISQAQTMEILIAEVRRLTSVVETQQASIDRLTRGT